MARPTPQFMQAAVLDWYRENARDLPWRRQKHPYGVWISEIMLQQTRVETVIPYYQRFLEKWPHVTALADADPDEVRAQWSGLGYYRRAQLMLKAAKTISSDLQGEFPPNAKELHKLPGFGKYTAGAVASIAYGEATAAVDGNVGRVLARVYGIEGEILKGEAQKQIWEKAEKIVPEKDAGDFNQGLIEIGALVCSRNPKCEQCPLKDACTAYKDKSYDRIPPVKKRVQQKEVELTALIVSNSSGQIVMEKQGEKGLFSELWCPILLEGALEPSAVADEFQRKYQLELDQVKKQAAFTHILTHRKLKTQVYTAFCGQKASSLKWFAPEKLPGLALPSFSVKVLQKALSPTDLAALPLPGRQTASKNAQGTLPFK